MPSAVPLSSCLWISVSNKLFYFVHYVKSKVFSDTSQLCHPGVCVSVDAHAHLLFPTQSSYASVIYTVQLNQWRLHTV